MKLTSILEANDEGKVQLKSARKTERDTKEVSEKEQEKDKENKSDVVQNEEYWNRWEKERKREHKFRVKFTFMLET